MAVIGRFEAEVKIFNTPILYIIFNRLDTVQQTFPVIKKQKPKYLYIAAGEFVKCCGLKFEP